MNKYRVTIPYACFVTVEVEAESESEAEEIAFEDGCIGSYCGNGGSSKLIGVTGQNVSIEANDEPLETHPYSIEIDEL